MKKWMLVSAVALCLCLFTLAFAQEAKQPCKAEGKCCAAVKCCAKKDCCQPCKCPECCKGTKCCKKNGNTPTKKCCGSGKE